MGLFQRKPAYITDRGDEYSIEDMDPSHLLNAINHHGTQMCTLERILAADSSVDGSEHIRTRLASLSDTIDVLVKELRTRDPSLDHED